MEDPNSFTGSPGYGFALNSGLDAVQRRAPGGRGSGNALAALTKYASDLARQDYDAEFGRRLSAASLEQQGDLAGQELGLGRDRLDLERELGTGRLDLESALGHGRLDLDRTNSERDFGLNMFRATSDYDLGRRGLDDSREGRWLNYDLGRRGVDADIADSENRFNLGADASERGWYDSRTRRGSARSEDWGRRNPQGGGGGARWSGPGAPGWSSLPRAAAPTAPQWDESFESRRPEWARYT
jgi:hypothetical protein